MVGFSLSVFAVTITFCLGLCSPLGIVCSIIHDAFCRNALQP